jgi:hypothetical protein
MSGRPTLLSVLLSMLMAMLMAIDIAAATDYRVRLPLRSRSLSPVGVSYEQGF